MMTSHQPPMAPVLPTSQDKNVPNDAMMHEAQPSSSTSNKLPTHSPALFHIGHTPFGDDVWRMRSIQQTPGLALQIADSVLQQGGDGAAGTWWQHDRTRGTPFGARFPHPKSDRCIDTSMAYSDSFAAVPLPFWRYPRINDAVRHHYLLARVTRLFGNAGCHARPAASCYSFLLASFAYQNDDYIFLKAANCSRNSESWRLHIAHLAWSLFFRFDLGGKLSASDQS